MAEQESVSIGDSVVITVETEEQLESLEAIEGLEPIVLDVARYHDDKVWVIAQEERGWYVSAEGYGMACIENQTFFDTQDQAETARETLVGLVGGTPA